MKTTTLLLLSLLATGCDKIFDENISTQRILITSPTDGHTTTNTMQVFAWQGFIYDSTVYHVEIVSPSFAAVDYYLLDTLLINRCSFSFQLQPAQYQWRIQARNFSYQTSYQYHNFTISSPPPPPVNPPEEPDTPDDPDDPDTPDEPDEPDTPTEPDTPPAE